MENDPSGTPNLDIHGWLKGVRLVLAVVVGLFAYMALRSLLAAPGFERVFEEMLGDPRKLPEITRFVIRYWPGLVLAVGGIDFAGVVFIWTKREGFTVCRIAIGLILVNFVTFQMAFSSLWAPMADLLRALSGGTDVTSTL